MTTQPDSDPRPERGGAFDYRGGVRPEYAPERDGEPDPGEIVWAWVPFEEDPSVGKDRPLVLVGRALDVEGALVAFMLSSKDKTGRDGWVGIGTGSWDGEHRPSWVRTDRILAIGENAVRREGAALDPGQFEAVITEARRQFGGAGSPSAQL